MLAFYIFIGALCVLGALALIQVLVMIVESFISWINDLIYYSRPHRPESPWWDDKG